MDDPVDPPQPSASPIHHIDVQPFLQQVCDGMAVGELLCGDTFNLHDAMIAIEIGDPKMDVGLRRGDARSAAQLIADGLAPVTLSLQQQVAVADRLLCMEATWHAGIMLSQTVFTSLYTLDTARSVFVYRWYLLRTLHIFSHYNTIHYNRIFQDMPGLHALCCGVVSTCSLFHESAINGQVVDDEDMLLHVFGFKLDQLNHHPSPKAGNNALRSTKRVLEQEIASSVHNGGGTPPQAPTPPTNTQSNPMVSRLRFRLLLLEIISKMHPATEESVAQVPGLCRAACELLDSFLATALPEEELAAAPGFAPEVHRKAMGLAPPRPVHVVPFRKAVEHWREMLVALSQASQWLRACDGSWGALRSGLVAFAATPKNLPLVRSLVHRAIVGPLRLEEQNNSKGSGVHIGSKEADKEKQHAAATAPSWCPSVEMIAREMQWLPATSPPPASLGPDAATFLEQCSIAVQGWCHCMCLNRCRQRRRLARLLEDWRNMTDHGFNAEGSKQVREYYKAHAWRWTKFVDGQGLPTGGPVITWVEKEAAGTMIAHIMMGMQLDLYAPYEYSAVYWYTEYLLGAAHAATSEFENFKPLLPPVRQSEKSKKKKYIKAQQHADTTTTITASAASMVAAIDRAMCQGMMRLCLALGWAGMISPPPASFNTDKERFHQRFSKFEVVFRPPPLQFEEFQRSTDPNGIEVSRVFLAAYESLSQAQQTVLVLESMADVVHSLSASQVTHVAAVKKVAMQNMMAIKLLLPSVSVSGDVQWSVGWDFKFALQNSTVMYYPQIVLKRAKK